MSSEIPIIAPQDDEFDAPRPSFRRRALCWLFDMILIAVAGSLINYFVLGIDPPAAAQEADPASAVADAVPDAVPAAADAAPDAASAVADAVPAAVPEAASNAEFVSVIILAFLYFALMHGRFGRSLGKMIGGFGIVSMGGARIGYGTAFARAFWSTGILALIEAPRLFFPASGPDWLSTVGALYLVFNFLALVWDMKYNRALHDRFAGTRVAMGR